MADDSSQPANRQQLPWRFIVYWIAASAVSMISVRALVRVFVATGAIAASDATLATFLALPVAFLVVALFAPRGVAQTHKE
jgi:uncharacterized membrane protein (UPF0136 family)